MLGFDCLDRGLQLYLIMLRWAPYAMVRVSAFFVSGVLLAIYQPTLIPFGFATTILLLLITSYFLLLLISGGRLSFYSGLIGLSAIFLLGYTHLLLQTESQHSTHLLKLKEDIEIYEAVVKSVPQSKAKSWKVEVEIIYAKTTDWHPVNGKILLYVSKKSGLLNWHYNDRLLIKGKPQLLKQPANPGEFDFKRFLSFKNIYHQQYVLPQDVKLISISGQKGIIYYSHMVRGWASQKLNEFIKGEQEQAIAAALVLGVTDAIDTDLQSAYAASGAMHVLAVSGLHVGIIYGILLFLLKPLNRFSWSRWLVAGISLCCLWGFAFVTGLSPSVLRAVTMFSFVAIARPFGQRTNIYNTLAASAFVLLLYNPYLIMSVGFQLSYLAVLGIVYLQRPIYNLWETKSKLVDWIWQITCISLAAQAATFALGILYFHQFPVYFLISNLFVIPLSTFILVGGVLLLAVNFISPLAWLIGKIVSWFISLLNAGVIITEKLPYSLINEIRISTFQCLLLMATLICFILLFEFKKAISYYAAFGFLFLFTMLQWFHHISVFHQNQLVVYSVSGHSAIERTERGKSIFYADTSLLKDEDRIRFHISPNRLIHGVNKIQTLDLKKDIPIFYWRGKSVAVASDLTYKWPANLAVDFLIVTNNSFNFYKVKTTAVSIKKIILASSNSLSYCRKLTKFARANKIEVYSVLENGAFVLTD